MQGSQDEKLDPDEIAKFFESKSRTAPFTEEGSKYRKVFERISVQNIFLIPSIESVDDLKEILLADNLLPAQQVHAAHQFFVESVIRIMNGLEKG